MKTEGIRREKGRGKGRERRGRKFSCFAVFPT